VAAVTDYTDPSSIDVDTVIGNIRSTPPALRQQWTADPSWPNVTVLALADEVVLLRRRLEFIEILCDGGKLEVNGVPWREMLDRVNAMSA
jgi:hypothetical protein